MKSIDSGAPTDPCQHQIFNLRNQSINQELTTLLSTPIIISTFPDAWKNAKVRPQLKEPSADPSELKNYKTISLLPFPVKVLEKIVIDQLMTHLEQNRLLDISQSVFCSNHSTETALIAVAEDIRTLLE